MANSDKNTDTRDQARKDAQDKARDQAKHPQATESNAADGATAPTAADKVGHTDVEIHTLLTEVRGAISTGMTQVQVDALNSKIGAFLGRFEGKAGFTSTPGTPTNPSVPPVVPGTGTVRA